MSGEQKCSTDVVALSISPDGIRVVAAVATRAMLYHGETGELIKMLKAHKSMISVINWSWDSTRFVSGDSGGKVIIWTSEGEGLLKYSHGKCSADDADASFQVKCVDHNPVTHKLCSAVAREIALWSPSQNAVVKKKMQTSISHISWRRDGEILALGFVDGVISLRDNSTFCEMSRIVHRADINVMTWMSADVLVVGQSNQITVYKHDGTDKNEVPLDAMIHSARYEPASHTLWLLLDDGGVVTYRHDELPAKLLSASDIASRSTGSSVALAASHITLAIGFTDGRITVLQTPTPLASSAGAEANWENTIEKHMANGDFTNAFVAVKRLSTSFQPCQSSASSHFSSLTRVRRWESKVLAVARAAEDVGLVRQCALLLSETPLPATSSLTQANEANIYRDRAMREICLGKLEDVSMLMAHYTRGKKWAEALALAEEKAGQFDPRTFLPYAVWLLVENPAHAFDLAMSLFYRYEAGVQARPLVEELVRNAVVEGRYQDASYYCWVLSVDVFYKSVLNEEESAHREEEYEYLSTLASVYAAFKHIHAYTQDPFTSMAPLALFQVARFLLNTLGGGEAPFGISKVATLYTITKQAQLLGAWSFAHACYSTLFTLNLPPAWRDSLEVDMLHSLASPFQQEGREEKELRPVCYQCGHVNPFLNPANHRVKESLIVGGNRCSSQPEGEARQTKLRGYHADKVSRDEVMRIGDVCVACGHPFIRCMLRYEVLPLVEFIPEPTLSEAEVLSILRRGTSPHTREGADAREANLNVSGAGNVGMEEGSKANPCKATIMNAATLRSLRSTEVFVCPPTPSSGAHERHRAWRSTQARQQEDPPGGQAGVPNGGSIGARRDGRSRFFRHVLYPDIPIAFSPPAQRFFSEEDFEMACLQSAATAAGAAVQEHEFGGTLNRAHPAFAPLCPFSRVRDLGRYAHLM